MRVLIEATKYMKIKLLSDLHLEFHEYIYQDCDCDIVVLAGDIHKGLNGIKWAIENISNKPVIYVMGNHEFYGETHQKLIQKARILAKGTNVYFLENECINIDGVNFYGCTLWTDYNLFGSYSLALLECQASMNDYRYIRRLPNYSLLKATDAARIHRESLSWLCQSLANNKGEINVVVTHHAPSRKSLMTGTENMLISAGYASDLEDRINQHKPTAWLHGHIHEAKDYSLHDCNVVCNPRGYPREYIKLFEDTKIIHIPRI